MIMSERVSVDISGCFGSEEYSDILVQFTAPVEGGTTNTEGWHNSQPPGKRQRTPVGGDDSGSGDDSPQQQETDDTLQQQQRVVVRSYPAHRLILQQSIEWARCKMKPDWSKDQPGILELQLDDESEVEAAELLLKCCYSITDVAKPLQGATQATLLKVLHLADRLRAEQCERAAIGILSSAAIGPLEWHTVTALYRLPPSIAHNEAYCPLYNAAAAALQDRLGDLDAAWLSQQLSRDLRNLPFAALKQLLSDARTRVVSENTAFYTVAAWLRRHKGATPEQERALAYRLRLPHITRLYLSSVVPRSDWLMHHISAADLMHAAAFAGTSDAARQAVVDDEAQLQVAPCASWKLPRRPPSKFSDAQVTVEWEVGLGEVRELHERALLATSAPAFIDSPAYVHQGLQWGIRLETQNKGGEMRYNAYVAAIRPPGTRPPLAVSAQISIWTRKLATGFSLWTFLGTSVALGEDDVFGSGVRGLEWDEAAWRAGGLVEENGKIKVCASIKDVV